MPAYNTDRILNRLEDFSRIKTKYCNEYYQDFHNSYIYKTSDLYFLKSKLNTYYERIYNSYEKIYAYWRTFFDDICNIDASIAGNPAGSISDSTVSSLIRNLPTLPEYNNNAQTLFGSAYASAHGSAHQSVEWLKWAKENPEEAQDLVFSTSAVVVGSIISGTAKVGEHIVESFVWVGGALAEGAIWLGYFFSDMSNEDRDFMLNDIKESTMDTIAEDWVGQGQQYFYENTEIGRDINAKSAIKYDSETAQIIQGVSEQVSVKLLEVAANLIPGGGPVISGIIGATYAAGSKAEEKFSDVENRDFWADSAIIAVNGVVGYADGYMTGKMTQTAVSGIKNIKAANSIKETLKQVGNSKVTKDGVQKLLKRTAVETFKEFDFYTDALGASADTIESAVEAKEWTLNDTMAIVSNVGVSYFTNFLGNLGGNMFEDAMMGVDIDKMYSSPSAKSDTLELEKLQKEYDDLIAYKNSDKFKTDEADYQLYRDKIGGNPYKQNMDRLEELERILKPDTTGNVATPEKVLRFADPNNPLKVKEVEISQLRGTKPNVQEVTPAEKVLRFADPNNPLKVKEVEISQLRGTKPNVQEVAPAEKVLRFADPNNPGKVKEVEISQLRGTKPNVQEVTTPEKTLRFAHSKSDNPQEFKVIEEIKGGAAADEQVLKEVDKILKPDTSGKVATPEKTLRFAGSDRKIKEVEISQLRGTKPNVQEVAPAEKVLRFAHSKSDNPQEFKVIEEIKGGAAADEQVLKEVDKILKPDTSGKVATPEKTLRFAHSKSGNPQEFKVIEEIKGGAAADEQVLKEVDKILKPDTSGKVATPEKALRFAGSDRKIKEVEISQLRGTKPNVQEVAPGAKKEADALVEEIRKRNISGFESTKSPEQIKAIQETYSKPSQSGKQDLSQIENLFSVDKAKNLTSEEKVLRFAGSDRKIKEVEISQLRGTKPNVQEVTTPEKTLRFAHSKSDNPQKKSFIEKLKTKYTQPKKVFADYKGDLKSYISDTMPKELSPVEKARYIYCKLNNEVSYSNKWNSKRLVSIDEKGIYYKKIDLNNYNGEEIICSNWSEMYAELLRDNGINCVVRGTDGGHRWVVFESNGKYYMADATNRFSKANDLTRMQGGAQSYGFIEITQEQAMSNKFANDILEVQNAHKSSNLDLDKMDKKLGFNYEDADKLFPTSLKNGNSSKELKHLGLDSNATTKDIVEAKLEKDLFEKMSKMGTMEGLMYYNNRKNAIFTLDEIGYVKPKWIINKDTGEMSVLYIVSGGKNYLYSGKNNIRVVDNDFANNYLNYGFINYS